MVGGWSACRPGIVVHRTVRLDRRDRRLHGPLPLTSPARTLVDLAPSVTRDRLEQAIAQAGRRRLAREDEILAAGARAGRRRGSVVLEQLLGAGATAYTRSAAERRLLSLIREAGLPPPRVNSRLAGLEVDFVWPRRKLVVEVDGYGYHSDRLAFENDRRRDAKLIALGYRIMRITWRQLCDEPVGVVARLATALASTAGQGAT
jgi:very-short-patch-repair endonuclease